MGEKRSSYETLLQMPIGRDGNLRRDFHNSNWIQKYKNYVSPHWSVGCGLFLRFICGMFSFSLLVSRQIKYSMHTVSQHKLHYMRLQMHIKYLYRMDHKTIQRFCIGSCEIVWLTGIISVVSWKLFLSHISCDPIHSSLHSKQWQFIVNWDENQDNFMNK